MNGNANADSEIRALLEDLWQRHLPSMHERLNLLDRAALSAVAGQLVEAERAEAQSIAHKLAGNLGMFGYADAGLIASSMEQLLKEPALAATDQLASLARQLRKTLEPYL
jgi:chemotaxis protein histidine kinase CheA